MTSAFLTGLGVGGSLIIAIGSQNAFVLRQGIRGEHVNSVCLACALSDSILIAAGVFGFQAIVSQAAWIEPVFLYAGAAFLAVYGAMSLRAAFTAQDALIAPTEGGEKGLIPTLGICLALTWLNPHVYLDTVFLIGSLSTVFTGSEHVFAIGAVTASFLFFFALGHGASLLRPIFARASAWRVLDGLVGLVMWAIALKLLFASGQF